MRQRIDKFMNSLFTVAETVEKAAKFAPKIARNPSTLREVIRDSELRRRLDPRVKFWAEQIEESYTDKKWKKVIDQVRAAMRITGAIDTPDIRLKLIYSHAQLGQLNGVDRQLEASLKRHPQSECLLKARAERAMSLRQYADALWYWQRSTDAGSSADIENQIQAFPVRGDVFDWYEFAWNQCADQWQTLWAALDETPSAMMYRKTIQTLTSAGEFERAERLSIFALQVHKGNAHLAMQASETIVRNSPNKGTDYLVEMLTLTNDSAIADHIAGKMLQAQTVLDDLETMGPTKGDELRILTAYRHGGVDFAARSGNFWDERRINQTALQLAKRDRWPEQTAETDLISAKAYAEATRFAESRAKEVGVSPPALARSVFHYFKQEITQKIPVDRIAEDIAKSNSTEPVFVDLGALKIPYMVSYPSSRMQALYFYDALRKAGCNVYLVRFPRRPQAAAKGVRRKPQITPMPVLTLVPQPAQLKPPARTLAPVKGNPGNAVVPAGIRSVRQVLDRVDGAVVVNSGSAVKGLAYDRSVHQEWDYPVNLNLHSNDKKLLPTFRIKTSLVRAWRHDGKRVTGSPVAPSDSEQIEAFLGSGSWVVKDWHSWLERAIVPYFRDLVKRIRLALQEHSILDAHIGDYMYAESTLIAAKVKDRGGRVHLWPHSTNPVHKEFHDPNHLRTVHAVTRSGAEDWKHTMPNVKVVHDSTLMLAPPVAQVPFVVGEPMSVVIIGGRPVMRNLPILDIDAHESLYKRLFAELEPLVRQGRVRVYFKPRGKTGEHETWLERLVGRSAHWERVLEHPLRMTLPNPIFVSVTVGSSALLEGVTRGIPGLIVREGFARDYLATGDDLFENLGLGEAVSLIGRMTDRAAWTNARDKQMSALRREL
ncbi:tetratricopeptide repeat protein [Brevibacterium antiquum]|uniref:Uncharacterized protein n=1 Tax=Brevibacterium antiquum TaxID=234835 RepID=A0A2H1KMT0_9MICO|nr:hypothetical protein [Brevibacterium antiquum]SMY00929.1 hypothetical protein BANT10_03230 [Brevibacterium antiquum]